MSEPRVHIETERLKLRDWTEADREPFAKLNADPRVMEFFLRPLTAAESDAFLIANQAFLMDRGYGKYAVEEKERGEFIGYVGLAEVGFPATFTPATEIGWRLKREAWGSGYASEGARAVLAVAFDFVGLPEVVSFTAEWNLPSQRVMQRIGMRRDPADDFDYPTIPAGHKLRRHVLYRLTRDAWLTQQAAG